MKYLISLILLSLAGCTGEMPPAEVPVPVVDSYSAEIANELTAAHDAVLLRPDDATLAGHYGMLLQAYRQDQSAVQMYERARKLAPAEYRWAYYRAYLLESLGDPESAIAAYLDAAKINPNYSPSHLRLANLLLEQGRLTQARDHFMLILKNNPGFAPAAVGLGQALMTMNNQADAEKVFEQVLSQDPNNASAHYGLAQIRRSQGEADVAAEHLRLFEQYRRVQGLSPDRLISEIGDLNQSDRPSMQRAGNSLSRGNIPEAIHHLNEAIRRNPSNSSARVSLVGMYAAVNDFANAEKTYLETLPMAPDNVKLHLTYGFSQQRRGLHAEAIEIFGRALTLNPDNADSLAYLGVSQLATGDRAAALTSLRRAVALNPQQREGNARLGQVLLENGDAENAVPYLTAATRRDDLYSITYLVLLGQALQQLDRPGEAEQVRQRAFGLARRFNDDRADALADAQK